MYCNVYEIAYNLYFTDNYVIIFNGLVVDAVL